MKPWSNTITRLNEAGSSITATILNCSKAASSLSYGLDIQARDIFSRLISSNAEEAVRNRAWFYLAKMLYLRGNVAAAAETISKISGTLPEDISQEYLYLAALINIKLGYNEEAENISRKFRKDSSYAPYLYFNLGVAFGKDHDAAHAVPNLKRSATYADGGNQLQRLADRSHMAIAHLDAESGSYDKAREQIGLVSTTGVYSNRALLEAGWISLNAGAYRDALAPLEILRQRSMAIPEVQEAALLVPHVFEKQKLPGRAAEGFIAAYDRYTSALDQLDRARTLLADADILELFVNNLYQLLGESDWFGTAPSVSLNPLSPFLLDLMADHSFQSVLKDLRDLYAIRNNLNGWKKRKDDFDVILDAHTRSADNRKRRVDIASDSDLISGYRKILAEYTLRSSTLDQEDRDRVQWILNDIEYEIDSAEPWLISSASRTRGLQTARIMESG